jgi:hypothetical protein
MPLAPRDRVAVAAPAADDPDAAAVVVLLLPDNPAVMDAGPTATTTRTRPTGSPTR